MVRRAFALLSDIPTRLFAFSDDMDALRKVPDNVPNQEMLRQHLGRPLTSIPDPFGTHESFGAHNNARLRGFLDQFGFDYEFMSATDCYRSGRFDQALLLALRHYDAITNIILPTLGPERRATYSPFLPVSAKTGCVLQVAGRGARCGRRHHRLPGRGRQPSGDAGHRRPLQAAVEGGLGDALGGARRRLRDGRQGPDRTRCGCRAASAPRWAAGRRRARSTSCSSTSAARKSPSRAATASRSRTGFVTRRPRAWRSSCSRNRRRRSGCTSASSRRPSTSTSTICAVIRRKMRRRGWTTRCGTSTPASRRARTATSRSPRC